MKTYRFTLDVLQANERDFELCVDLPAGGVRTLYAGPLGSFNQMVEQVCESIFETIKPDVTVELAVWTEDLKFRPVSNGLVRRTVTAPNGSIVIFF